MSADPDVAATAALVGEPTRAAMLLALLGGQSLPASDLARRAGMRPSVASTHLAKLARGGLVVAEPVGRHRYYRLAGEGVARAVEALAAIAPPGRPASLRAVQASEAMQVARSCYDHLAGRVGVAVADSLVAGRLVEGLAPGQDCTLTARGERRLRAFGIDADAVRAERRLFARGCLDWTERRPHVAGALGAALLARMLEAGWFTRRPRDRALRVTASGAAGLADVFGVDARV